MINLLWRQSKGRKLNAHLKTALYFWRKKGLPQAGLKPACHADALPAQPLLTYYHLPTKVMTWATCLFPFSLATSLAFLHLLSTASSDAPQSSNAATHSTWPLSAARCSGVDAGPLCVRGSMSSVSWHSSFSKRMTSSRPAIAASWSGVQPFSPATLLITADVIVSLR